MRNKTKFIAAFGLILLGLITFSLFMQYPKQTGTIPPNKTKGDITFSNFPLSIEYMRKQNYPGNELKIEQTLTPGINYKRYIASYKSEGLKIFGLLSIPNDAPSKAGYPAIIFNHGYLPPEEYVTTERYIAYFDNLARTGYVVFKPDLRGHGNSEGQPTGAYYSPGYTIDVLNALTSVKKLSNVNKNKIGMWGHSMGGYITLRSMVITKDVKAGVIWGGVVGSYKDLFDDWWNKRNRPTWTPSERERQSQRPSRQKFIEQYGQPTTDSKFWNAISANFYLDDISGPIQLHHGYSDETVPPILSQKLFDSLKKLNKTVELYTYEGADHNISDPAFSIAMDRTVKFFDKYLK